MTIRVYSLLDVLQQLNQDSTAYLAPNPNEIISQFMQGNETLKGQPSWTDTDYTPYPFMVADQDGPTGFWLLNDPVGVAKAFDSNPYNQKFHATPTNVTFGSAGPMTGSAAATCGSTSSILTASTAIGGMGDYSGTASFSVEAWVYLTSTPAANNWVRVCERETYATRNGWSLLGGNNSNNFWIERWAAGAQIFSPTFTLTLNTWTHLVGMYDGAKLHLYVNGVEQGTGTATTASVTAQASAIGIGCDSTGGSGFPGRLFGVAVYPVALTPTQILNHYNWGIAANVDGGRSCYAGVPSYIRDASFESGSLVNVQNNWLLGVPAEFSYDTANFRNGKASILCTTTRTASGWNVVEANPSGIATVVAGIHDLIPVVANANYFFSTWVKQSAGSKATHFKIVWYTSAAAVISTSVIAGGTDGYLGWTNWSGTVTAPGTAAYAVFDLMSGYWDGVTGFNANIWWDDAYMALVAPSSAGKYGLMVYPNPPKRGSNLWGSAIWGSFTWG